MSNEHSNNKVPVDKREFLLDRIEDDYFEFKEFLNYNEKPSEDERNDLLRTGLVKRHIVYNVVKNLSKSKIRGIYADFRALPKKDKRTVTGFVTDKLNLDSDITKAIEDFRLLNKEVKAANKFDTLNE